MRVEAHAHVAQEAWIGEGWWQGLSRVAAAVLPGVTPELVREAIIPAQWDEDGSGQLGAMEVAGIDVAIMFAHDWSTWRGFGISEVGWRDQNEWYRAFAEANPGRIRWGFGADPRHDGAVDALQEALSDHGAVCVKIHPTNGFNLDDPVVYPFVEAAGQANVPVVFHVGPSVGPGYSEFSDAMRLDRVAADFPDVRIVAGHTGNLQWRDVLAIASVKPNIVCELSGWQIRFQRDPARFYDDVREVLNTVGAHRVMWGTDAPYYRAAVSDDTYVAAFTDAPEGTFSAEEVDAILGGTAAALFGLS